MISALEHYACVCRNIAGARAAYGLKPGGGALPRLIVVTKQQPAELILPLLEAGHREFGENRVQEAAEKWPPLLEKFPDIRLHLIGALQTNKVKPALALFSVFHTLDRPSLLEAFATHAGAQHRFLVQVNTGDEPQKSGVSCEEAPGFIAAARQALGAKLVGLMCIPPVAENPAPHFALLKKMAQEAALPELSMGMSGDYVLAAAMGATYVRVGSAIFGERQP